VGNINIHNLETQMQIKTQPFKEAIEIKNTGIAFDVYNSGAKRIGDLAVTKNGLVWNNGSAQRKAVTVKWDDFITWMQKQTQTNAQSQARTLNQTRTANQARTQAQPQSRTLTQPQTRTATKAKIAAKTGNAISAKKPTIKITASAKTARKKAH
jgi:hypothetical protein